MEITDRENIISAFEDYEPYAHGLPAVTMKSRVYLDVLALLKEQKPVEPIAIKQAMFDECYGAVSCCPKCDCMWVMLRENNMHFCPECGQAVKWE